MHLFSETETGEWIENKYTNPNKEEDRFGPSVSIDNGMVIVGTDYGKGIHLVKIDGDCA